MRNYADLPHFNNVKKLTANFLLSSIAITAIFFWLGCSTTKRLQTNEILLKKVIVKCGNENVSKDDIYGYLKQKPNRKIFGINGWHILKRGTIGKKNLLTNGAGYPLYLQIYNLINPTRDAKRVAKRDARYEKKYQHWLNHQTTKKGKPIIEPKKRRTIGEFFADIGEAPVIIDSSVTNRSIHQIGLYLNNKGYFNSTVKDTLIYPWLQRKKKKKAILCYLIVPAQPYTIRKVSWDIQDVNIAYDLQTDTSATYLSLIHI